MAKATKKIAEKEVKKVELIKEENNESKQEPTQSSESSITPEVKTETSIKSKTEINGNTEATTQEIDVKVTEDLLKMNPYLVDDAKAVGETIKVGDVIQVPVNENPEQNPLKFVIPYLKKAASGNELKYALRSIHASFPDAVLIMVGDKEDWFSEEIIHLEHTPESDNPQIDVAQKLLLVLASGVVDDRFILSNDDIFLLGKTTTEDIYVHKAFGELNAGVGQKDGRYNKNAANSQKQLLENNLPIHRYGTHTPVALYSEELAETIEQYKADEEGHLITSLYFNTHYPDVRPIQINGGKHDPILVSVYRADAPIEVLEEALAKRKFCNVNDTGWKVVEPYLVKMFPDKSKWEI